MKKFNFFILLFTISFFSISAKAVTLNAIMENVPDTLFIQELLPDFKEKTGIDVEFEIMGYGEMHPKMVPSLTSSTDAIEQSLIFSSFLILLREAFLSPAIRHNMNVFSVLKSKLFTIAPTSQSKDEAACRAVLADDFKIITLCFGSNSLSDFSAFLTPSLSNKVIIQLLLVSYFKHLIIQLCKICIGVIK